MLHLELLIWAVWRWKQLNSLNNQLLGIMSPRASTQTIILIELAFGSLCLLVGYISGSNNEVVWLVPTMLFIHLVVFSAPLAFAKGFDFVIYDADPRSPWKLYGFVAIFISVFLGSILDNSVADFFLALAT